MVLWKKESIQPDACYIDLMDQDLQEYLEYRTMKFTSKDSFKDDTKSTESRMHANQQFEVKIWREAMELYNRSLRCTPHRSENVSLAYANRSACFLHMKMYDECLVDIRLARAANYPQRLMHKLDERQRQCMELMAESTQRNEIKGAALSYAPNEQFPSLANVLDIQSNDEFGKHIVAKQDIYVGQIVLVEEAFVHGMLQTDRTCCKTCLQTKKNFIPCPNCSEFMFCCVECMESNTVHKLMCGISCKPMNEMWTLTVESILLAAAAIPNANRLMKFVESALATRDLDTPKCDTVAQAKYRMFLKLFALPKELNEVSKLKITFTYQKLMETPEIKRCFQSTQSQRFLMHLIWQHFCILETNSISLEMGDKGSGDWHNVWMLASYFSLFNHSCYPNAINQIQGCHVFVCTIRPIKEGEQLFIEYYRGKKQGDIGLQQTSVGENFQFQCKCSKCIPSWKQENCLRIQKDPDFLFISQINQSYFKDSKKRTILKGKALTFLNKYGRLPCSIEIEKVIEKFEYVLLAEYVGYVPS